MRVLKGNSVKYVSFHKSLPTVSKRNSGNKKEYLLLKPEDLRSEEQSSKEVLDEVSRFISLLNGADTINKVNHVLINCIKSRFEFLEAGFFLFDSNNSSLNSPDESSSAESYRFVNNAYKEGILEWAFSSKSPRSVPVYGSYFLQEAGNYSLIVPLFDGMTPKGVFSIIHNQVFEKESNDISYLQVIINYAFLKINMLLKSEETRLAYNSLQAYQSKLSNDYRLFAVGELAGGVLEEILDPLQVIYTSVDLLQTNNENRDIISAMKNQVRKIELSADRLIKFADRSGYSNKKVLPCDLNKIIENYNAIISSSLEKKQIECILDLEPGLPTILTNSDLINQMLVNIFSIITADFTKPGGILIQTQLIKDIVKLSFITTEVISALDKNSSDPNYRIISQLVQKHEGQIEINSNDSFGSRIEIRFPLKRKIRA